MYIPTTYRHTLFCTIVGSLMWTGEHVVFMAQIHHDHREHHYGLL